MRTGLAIAIAAVGQLEEESRQLHRKWTLRRERSRYEAERARRQYHAVEPKNRRVARSLERAWEEKLRPVEAVEQEYTTRSVVGSEVRSIATRIRWWCAGKNW